MASIDERYEEWKKKKRSASGGASGSSDTASEDDRYRSWRAQRIDLDSVASSIADRTSAWLKNHRNYLDNYKYRYSGRKGTYEDAYVSDASDWLDTVTAQKENFDKEANSILAMLDKYGDYLSKDWADSIRSALTTAGTQQADVLKYATGDSDFWAQFKDQDEYGLWQTDQGYRSKYSGKSYEDIQAVLEAMEDGEEKQWLGTHQYDLLRGNEDFSDRAASGWETYMADEEAKAQAKAQVQEEESFWEKIGRWLGPAGAVDTSIPLGNVGEITHNLAADTSYQRPSNNWTEEQNAMYGYLYGIDKSAAAIYAHKTNEANNQTENAQKIAAIEEWATKNGWTGAASTIGAIAMMPLSLADTLSALTEYNARGFVSTPSTPLPGQVSNAITGAIAATLNENGGTISEKIPVIGGKGFGDAYQLGTSIAQSIISGYTQGGLGTYIVFFGSASSSAMYDAKNRGATDEQAITFGILSGLAEAAGEAFSVEHLLSLGGVSELSSFFANVLLQAGIEASEEGVTTLINNFSDQIVMGDKSNFNILVQQYMSEGMPEEEAKKAAWKSMANDWAFDMLGGAISGGVSSGLQTGVQTMFANRNAKQLYGGSQQELVGEALEIDPGNTFAQKMQQRLEGGKSLSGGQLNRLVQQNEATMTAQDMTAIQSAVEKRLTKLGESGDVSTIAKALAKQAAGEKLSHAEKQAISRSQYGSRVANELNTENIQSGGYASQWAENIGTNRINAQEYGRMLEADQKAQEAGETTGGQVVTQAQNEAQVGQVAFAGDNVAVSKKETTTQGVSEDGVTRQVSTGKEVQPKKIVSISDGKVMIETDNGTVAADDIEFGTTDTDLLWRSAVQFSGITTAGANGIIRAYRSGESVTSYLAGAGQEFRNGYYNLPSGGEMADKLTPAQREIIYELGQKAAGENIAREQAAKKTAGKKQKATVSKKETVGAVHFDRKGRTFDAKRETALKTMEQLSKALGVEFYVFESYRNEAGKLVYKDANGVERPAPNGFYDPKDGSIHIDLNAGADGKGTMLFTIAHELTHFIKEWSPAKFKVLANFLVTQYGEKGVSVERLVDAQIAKAERTGRTIDYDTAFEEVVADSMEAIMTDGHVVQMMADLKQQDKNLWQKICDWFKDLVADLKALVDAYKGVKPDSYEGKMVAQMQDVIVILESFYAAGLADASENYQAARAEKNTTREGDVKYQARRLSSEDLDAYLKAGTRNNKNKIDAIKSGKKIILTSAQEIIEFIRNAIAKKAGSTTVAYGKVNDRLANEVLSESKGKIEIKDNYLELIPENLQHAYEQHNKAKEEGDIDLSKEDFERIPEYLDSYTEVLYAIRYSSGNVRICVSKKLDNGRILIIETVSKSRGSIQFKNAIGVSEEKYVREYLATYKKRAETNTRGSESSNNSLRDSFNSKNSIRSDDGIVKEKFSLRETVEHTKDLVAFHNITPKLLTDVLARKSLLMPSLAITNQGMTDFGEISLVFGRDTIDPSMDAKNKLYGADAWTPTQTQLKKNAKFDTNKTVAAVNSMKEHIGSEYAKDLFHITAKQFRDTILKADGSIYDAYAHHIGVQTAYAMEKGILSQIPVHENGSVDKVALQEQLNSELDTDDGWRQYKRWLNQISDTVITSYDQATNEDILRNMSAQPSSAKTFKLTENGELVVPATEYATIDEARKNKNRLSVNAAEAAKAVADKFLALANKIGKDTKKIVNAINSTFSARYSVGDIVRSFHSRGIEISTKIAAQLQGLYQEAVELPAQYFEAKPHREVGLDEIKAVVMPAGENLKNEDLTQIRRELEKMGVQIVEYAYGDNQARAKALNSIESVKFSDRDYMDAVMHGDMDAAQKMVDEVAKNAGYTIKGYHGSPARFTVFDKNRVGKGTDQFGAGFYFGTTDEISKAYGGEQYEVYLDIKKPIKVYRTMDGGDLYDLEITPTQAYKIAKKHPLMYDAEESPLGDFFDSYWETGAKEWMVKELARSYTSIGLLDGDLFRSYPNELHEAIRDVLGYDGVEVSFDNADSKFYVAWFDNQIKSSDPVVRDDNGNVIPLSERFNVARNDIRYSERDSEGKQLSEAQQKYFKDSVIRNANGDLVPMYHGTMHGGFTVFGGRKDYWYFTNDRKYAYTFEGKKRNGQFYPSVKEGVDAGHYTPQRYKVYLNVTNPFVTDDADVVEDALYWDRTLASKLREKGYDALMLEDMSQVIVLNANQIKNTTNKNPTSDSDIRFSERDPELEKVNQVLAKENAELKYDIAYLKEMLKLQRTVTGGTKFTKTSVEASAGQLMKYANAKGDKAELAKLLNGLYEYIAKGEELTWEGVTEAAQPAVDWLQDHVKANKQLDSYAQDVLREIRGSRIYLDELQKKEVAYQYGSYNDYRKSTMGSVILTDTNAVSLDTQWHEWAQMYPNLFDPEISSNDMPAALMEVFDDLRGMTEMDAYGYDRELFGQDLLRQVYDSYWNVSTLYTVADKAQKEITKLKIEHSKRMSNLRQFHRENTEKLKAEHREALQKVKQEARERLDRKLQETKERYQQSREKNAENRHKTEMRRKIRRTIMDLKKILNKGDKKRNVKEDMKDLVAEALRSADILFTDNYSNEDMIRDGVGTELTEQEAKYMAEAQGILAQIEGAGTAQERQEAENALQGKLDYRVGKLKDVFLREKARLNKATVSEVLGSLADAYASLENSEQTAVKGAFDENVYQYLTGLKEEVGGTIVKDMSLNQLEELHRAYTMVLTTVRNANKMFAENLKQTREQLGNQTINEVKKTGGERKFRSKAEKTANAFSWNNQKPVYAFERIGSPTLAKLFENTRAGEDTWAQDMTQAREYYLEQTRKYKYDTWDFGKQFQFTSSSGTDFALNLEQIMSLYAYSKREQAHDHLLKGGFVFDDATEVIVEKARGIKRAMLLEDSTAYNVSMELLAEIVGKLSAEQKAFVDQMQDYLSTTMGEKGNEVSMQLYGVKLFNEKYYFPLRSAGQYMERAKEADMKKQQGQISIVNSGFTKSTTPKSSNPVVLSGFMDVWADHVNEMSMYHSFVLPMEDFRRVYNYSSPNMENQAPVSVNSTIRNAYGKAATDYIDQLYRDLNGGAVSDPRENLVKKLTGSFKKAAVFASLSVVVQQPSAIGRAFAIIDPKYFIGSRVDHKRRKALWAQLKQYAPVAVIKEMGYFDTGMGKSAQDFLTGKEYNTLKEKAAALFTDGNYRDEVLSKLPALADELTWCAIWEAAKRETKAKNPKMDVKSEEFLQLAGKRFTEVITRTQVYDSVLARSANMRSKGALMSMWTAFMAEPTTTINMMEDAVRKSKQGDKKYAARATGAVLTSIILNSLLASLVYSMRDDDEDEAFVEKYVQSFATEMLDGINPITYYPFLKDIWSALQGFDIERADMSLITSLTEKITKLVQVYAKDAEGRNEGELAEAWWGVVDYATALAGVPVKNVRRDIDGAFNVVKTIANDLTVRDTSWGSLLDKTWDSVKNAIPVVGWLPDETAVDKLYKATVSGDTAYQKRLESAYSSQSSLDNAIRKGLRENDSRIWEAALCWNNNDLEGYKRIAKEIVAEGNFSQDNVVMAIQAEAKAMLPKESESSSESKAKGYFTADKFAVAVSQGNDSMADTIRADIIDTAQKNGKSVEEAEDSFISSAKSSIKELFQEGGIAKEQATKALVDYFGISEEDAAEDVQYWAFQVDHSEYDLSESAVTQYYEYAESAGIGLDMYYDYYTQASQCESDLDKNGNAISGSKKKKIMAVIDSMNLTKAQKDALYYANGWSKSTIYEAPWR